MKFVFSFVILKELQISQLNFLKCRLLFKSSIFNGVLSELFHDLSSYFIESLFMFLTLWKQYRIILDLEKRVLILEIQFPDMSKMSLLPIYGILLLFKEMNQNCCLSSIIKNSHDLLCLEILSDKSQFTLLISKLIPRKKLR